MGTTPPKNQQFCGYKQSQQGYQFLMVNNILSQISSGTWKVIAVERSFDNSTIIVVGSLIVN